MLYFIKGLKNVRNEKGISQEKLAKLSSVGERTIKRIETGSSCNRNTLDKLGKILPTIIDTVIEEPSEGCVETPGSIYLPVDKIYVPALNEHELSSEIVERIEKVFQTFGEFIPPASFSEWVSDFAQEPIESLEGELALWEALLLAYERFIIKYPNCSLEQKTEICEYLMERSTSPKNQIRMYKPKFLSNKSFKFLQSICRFKGVPVGVKKVAN
ncbi:hypothetical protein JCM30760_09980 [Thiomicrorhabdus hydrogeniphila]